MARMSALKVIPYVTLSMIFSWTGFAAADEDHYNNIIIGDRPAGMGGAYTAISDDPSGLYYNPAGSSDIRKHEHLSNHQDHL